MSVLSRSDFAALLFATTIIFFFSIAPWTEAADDSREATADEEELLQSFGIISSKTTDSAISSLKGGCDYNPYPILERYKTSGAVYLTPRAGGGNTLQSGIDPALACRLTKLLQAAAQHGCNARINSAYRSTAHQASICGGGRPGCAAPGKSCHQYGLAVDLTTDCGGWLRRAAPQFNLHFPYSGIHVQCIEHRTAGVGSCNKPCNGGLPINPDLSNIPPPSAPSSGLSNAIRNAMNPQPQPQQQPQQPQQTLPTSQQPFSQQPTPISNLLTPSSDTSGKLPEQGTSSTKKKIPAIDQINAIADPSLSSGATGTSTPFALTISGSDAQTLAGNPQPVTPTGYDNAYPLGPPGVQQTFISGDLSQSPGAYPPQQLSTLQKILATMKETLLRVLAYLRPFGRPYPEEIHEQEFPVSE